MDGLPVGKKQGTVIYSKMGGGIGSSKGRGRTDVKSDSRQGDGSSGAGLEEQQGHQLRHSASS
jgi:hypothetical protein